MIDTIYEEIRDVLLGLKLKEAKEYFDFDNIPESLTDNAFTIAPIEFGLGNSIKSAENVKIIGLVSSFKINLAMSLSANNIISKMKTTLIVVENILKGILAITVGEDEKDLINFVSAPYTVESKQLIYEINFDINYRIKNY
jgi:hypothetical protein